MFSKQLIDYTESTFKEEAITIRTKTMVKNVTDKYIEAEVTNDDGSKSIEKIPYGLLVWATGNAVRPVVRDLMAQLPAQKNSRRGLAVNEYLVVNGAENVWAVGDCAVTNYAPTAQVASQEGTFLGRLFNTMAKTDALEKQLKELSVAQAEAKSEEERVKVLDEIRELQKQLRRTKQVGPFQYSHQGSLAYIGKERAVADISWLSGNLATGGTLTYLFWRSAYLSMCFSSKSPPMTRNLPSPTWRTLCPRSRPVRSAPLCNCSLLTYFRFSQLAIVFLSLLTGSRRNCSAGMFHGSRDVFRLAPASVQLLTSELFVFSFLLCFDIEQAWLPP
jgi:NADH:ubiquinone reductase (non-electrogenic)